MVAATTKPFESAYGFKGPNFSVDANGNITANSISLTQGIDTGGDTVFNFVVTDDGSSFSIENYVGDNPTITLKRGTTYTFNLQLSTFDFYIKLSDGTTNQTAGLTHSDGDTGDDAQGKTSGTLSFAVPFDAPDTLLYKDLNSIAVGTINIIDPTGLFSSVDITGGINSTSTTTGSLTVDGGVGITEDLYVGGELNLGGVGIPRIDSLTNLELNAANKIVLQIENTKLGELNSLGLAATINNSTINNTPIGQTSPSTAVFSAAEVIASPTENNDVSNKGYVDTTATALAIAFGL